MDVINISAGSQQASLPSMLFHSKGWTGGCFAVWFCWPCWCGFVDSCSWGDCRWCLHVFVHLFWVRGWNDRSNRIRNDPMHKIYVFVAVWYISLIQHWILDIWNSTAKLIFLTLTTLLRTWWAPWITRSSMNSVAAGKRWPLMGWPWDGTKSYRNMM